jgi:tetratricopeptide (TPR) repeat protein
MKDYFEVLDIDEQSGQQDIQKAYRRMLGKYPAEQYPEKNRDIKEAYEALTNPRKRYSCIEFHRMRDASKQAYMIAREAIDKGEYAKAAKTLEEALKHEAHAIHLKYVLGMAYMNMNKPARAVRMLEAVHYEFPYDIELNIIFIKACLEARDYDRALVWAEECYDNDKNNFVLVGLLVDGYQSTKEYGEAMAVLKEAYENPAFLDKRYVICARAAYVLFLDEKYDDSLEWLDKLTSLQADAEEKAASVDVFMIMLDHFIDKHMLSEAGKYARAILRLIPDRRDIDRIRRGIEVIMSIEPEVDRFDRDEFIPDLLKMYVASGIGGLEEAELTEEQQKAYLVLLEYQLLSQYSSCLIAVRYMKTNYPALYGLKADFLDSFQDSRERKKLINKNKVQFCQYQEVIAQLFEELSNEYCAGEYDMDDDDWDNWDDDEDEEYDGGEDGWDDEEYNDEESGWDDDEYNDEESDWEDEEYDGEEGGWDDDEEYRDGSGEDSLDEGSDDVEDGLDEDSDDDEADWDRGCGVDEADQDEEHDNGEDDEDDESD